MDETGCMMLPEYLGQWGGRLPCGSAVYVLESAVGELAAGRPHDGVCPENIFVRDNRAHLCAPGQGGGGPMPHEGYTAPELCRAGPAGPWSDVYSVCAVLYYMITGRRPLTEAERLAGGANDLTGADVDEARGAVIMAGLALDPAYRPQSCEALLAALGVQPARAGKRMGAGARIAVIAASAFLALCLLGAGGYFIYNDVMYNRAVACISGREYARAIDGLGHVLGSYKSAGQWMSYARGCNDLENGRFEYARAYFKGLGGFEDSADMLREVDYREALALLDGREYRRARDMFAALGGYMDSTQMALEADYRTAAELLGNGKFREALAAFSALAKKNYRDSAGMASESKYRIALELSGKPDLKAAYAAMKDMGAYKDAEARFAAIEEKLYREGISYYRDSDYEKARADFKLLGAYERCEDYLTIMDANALERIFQEDYRGPDYAGTKAVYDRLTAMGDFENAAALRTSNGFIYFRLEGYWGNQDGYFFKLTYRDGDWYTDYNIPWVDGKYYLIGDRTLYVGEDEDWHTLYLFTFISENEMRVYCYKDGKTYTLTR